MSKLLNLSANPGARKKKKRLGRGNASGRGSSATRGIKGQKQRTGGTIRPGFEGGQTPLSRRMPKLKGFKNPNRVPFQVINVDDLNLFEDNAVITNVELHEKRLINKASMPVKILGTGELTKKVTVHIDSASESAKKKIEAAGGKLISTAKVVEKKEEK